MAPAERASRTGRERGGWGGEWDEGAEKRGKERAREVCVQKEG